jgi:hypothetical protein
MGAPVSVAMPLICGMKKGWRYVMQKAMVNVGRLHMHVRRFEGSGEATLYSLVQTRKCFFHTWTTFKPFPL